MRNIGSGKMWQCWWATCGRQRLAFNMRLLGCRRKANLDWMTTQIWREMIDPCRTVLYLIRTITHVAGHRRKVSSSIIPAYTQCYIYSCHRESQLAYISRMSVGGSGSLGSIFCSIVLYYDIYLIS